MAETRTLAVPVYRTPAGMPTCALHTGEVCPFYHAAMIGMREVCHARKNSVALSRGKGKDDDYVIPGKHCPLWKGNGQ